MVFIKKLPIFLLSPQYVRVYLLKLYQEIFILKRVSKDCTGFSTETDIINKSLYQSDAALQSSLSTDALVYRPSLSSLINISGHSTVNTYSCEA